MARHLSPLTAGTVLLLNNELNLDSASGGDLGAALSLVQCFVARMHVLAGRTHAHIAATLSLLPATSSCGRNVPLIGSGGERDRAAELGDIEGS